MVPKMLLRFNCIPYFSVKTCCGYSLEALTEELICTTIGFLEEMRKISRITGKESTCNEYLQHMFLWRNKKNINTFGLQKRHRSLKFDQKCMLKWPKSTIL